MGWGLDGGAWRGGLRVFLELLLQSRLCISSTQVETIFHTSLAL